MENCAITESGWETISGRIADPDAVPDGIEVRTNIDGTLDFGPLPLAMKGIWLFNNGGEKNDVY
jgi:hypothetical protein